MQCQEYFIYAITTDASALMQLATVISRGLRAINDAA